LKYILLIDLLTVIFNIQDSHEFMTSALDQIRVELTAASRFANADTANIELAIATATAADTPTSATISTPLVPSASAITAEPLSLLIEC
jgi:hypothetical protein